ncbi:MAG: ester cyclase [Pseudomonadota bacterium]
MTAGDGGAYGADDDIVDYILGITFEIWEQKGVDLIRQYYGRDCVIWGMDGITRGAQAVVDATRATLTGFPDRRLLGENVVWSGSRDTGYYTSHRLLSVATNTGSTAYGPATGRPLRMTNIADCVIEEGVITREWLLRDNMVLATQLGADPLTAARGMAERRNGEHKAWLLGEADRVARVSTPDRGTASPRRDPNGFAWNVLGSVWRDDRALFDSAYAPYAYLHRSPLLEISGRDAIYEYYRSLRAVLGGLRFSVDHVASQPFAENGVDIAVRWTVAGEHAADFHGVAASGKPLFVLGATHWRCIDDRIASEVTVFDELALLSQTQAG